MKRVCVALAAALALAAGCATPPKPSGEELADACALLSENKSWYKAMRAAQKEWGAPVGYQLAVIRQESGFDAKARPERQGGFLFLPGKRPSSAFGYAQALDATWRTYQDETGNGGADRHSFRDSADFIGWYFSQTARMTRLKPTNFKGHYLAYHEGQNGYLRGTWKKKKWLVQSAERVAANASTYERQVKGCKALKPKFLGLF